MNSPIVTDGHGVPLETTSHDDYIDRILTAIEADEAISQRSLARELGIALGLTNLLVRGLVSRGLVRVSKIHPRRLRYLLTPAGLSEKTRMSRLALVRAVERYGLARQRLRAAFKDLSASWPSALAGQPKRLVFWGTGEIAEIGFICLQETDLVLAAAVDDQGRARFFDVPVIRESEFGHSALLSVDARIVMMMSLKETESLQHEIARSGIRTDCVVWP